ncbi:DinB family protein [Bacillus atrophaeus]|uniref:DinB family protein n=1 Tax=Bacillus atrophaeus TaxID=1452 RepID=UPI000E28B7DD|nr:hypothetical protein [Bacillus atrophaeus]
MRVIGWSVFSAKQFSKTHILRHVMTHRIHHNGNCCLFAGIPPVAANFFNRTI